MNLIISFSARENGNCDRLAEYISGDGDKIIFFRKMDIHPCINCNYECLNGVCSYRKDDIYGIYDEMCNYEKVILLVPMYCSNPSSLYFTFNERCQDYFMHNDSYEEIIKRLYIIGIYGNKKDTPDFVPCLEKWFECSPYSNRVLGIERHLYNQKIKDSILDEEEVKRAVKSFLALPF